MKMSNSPLVTYKHITKHKTKGRGNHSIQKIFVHHMAGNLTVKQCGNVFDNRQASAHYGINGTNIGQYVDESDTAWHCGNFSWNQRSIGIELANDGGSSTGWHVSDATINTAIKLIADICERNNIKKLNYTGDLNGNLCMHKWVCSTACPGTYLASQFKRIADGVNERLTPYYPTTPYTGAIPTKTVKKGSKGTDVKAVQAFLNWCINAKLSVDGVCGKYTDEAIRKWQKQYKSYGIKADGVFGKASIAAAKKIIAKYAPEPTFLDEILEACKAQAECMKNSKYGWRKNPNVENSEEEGTCVTFVACVLQRLKYLLSGKYLWHDKKGKVIGATDNMEVIYPKNKKLRQLKSELKAGDIIMDGSKSDVGSGSHIFIFTGKWDGDKPIIWDNHSGQQNKGAYAYDRNRNVIAIVRLKQVR